MIRTARTAVAFGALMTVLLGAVYPALVWAGGHLFWTDRAEGSLLRSDGRIIGSALVGQVFTQDKYFHGRPSASPVEPYNTQGSGASNLSPANPALFKTVEARLNALKTKEPVPIDFVTASASGLDPHISPQAARLQIPRIAKARKIPPQDIEALITRLTEPSFLGFLGQERVNVLLLNRRLDHP